MNRRRFFREGLRELLRPVAKAAAPIERMVNELGQVQPTQESAREQSDGAPRPTPAGGTVPAARPTGTGGGGGRC